MKKIRINCLQDYVSLANIKDIIPADKGDLICIQSWCGPIDTGEWLSTLYPVAYKVYVESDYETEMYLLAAYHNDVAGEIEYAPICDNSLMHYKNEGTVYFINYKRYTKLMGTLGIIAKPFKQYLKEFIEGSVNDHCISLKETGPHK